MIPYAHQAISEDDIFAVQEILRSEWLTQGPTIERFEQAVAHHCDSPYSVAICNATAALHLACLALGLDRGDIIFTSTNSFVASANCALYCGAQVDFIDIDQDTYNLCPQSLAEKLAHAKKIGKLPKIVIVVHFAGQPCNMRYIHELAKQYGFFIIEDASHAIGAHYLNTKIGDCTYSDMTVFSFHPVKLITTGEGGMILTKNLDLYKKLVLLRSHGITRDPIEMTSLSEGAWYYQQIALGYNYRMTDIQAALGISQLQQLEKFIQRRNQLAQRYQAELSELPLILPWQHPHGKSAWHLYVIQLKDHTRRAAVFDRLRTAGIYVNVHYIPIHTQPFYQKLGFTWGDYKKAEQYYQGAITLPLYYHLHDDQQTYIIEQLKEQLM